MSINFALAGIDGLPALVSAQAGVASRAQLRALGIDRHRVRSNVEARRWQVAGRVVVLYTGPLSREQRIWVALLSQHGKAAAAGITAATELGLRWFTEEDVHLIVREGAHPVPVEGARIHVSRRFDPVADLHPGRVLPTVRVERALVDGAVWTVSDRRACGMLAAGVQQRLTTATRLRSELLAAGMVRRRRLLLAVLGDIEGGAHSFDEIDFGRLVRLAGLPPPRRQRYRRDRAGKFRYIDVELESFDVEIDGALHWRPLAHWDDMARHNDLITVTGRPLLRFSTVAIRLEGERVIAQLRAADQRFGNHS